MIRRVKINYKSLLQKYWKMDPSAENRINLATLQRYDSFVITIRATAKQTTLYQYQPKAEEWVKTDVDGACFVYQRSAPPFYAFMILNRLGTKNFVEPIQPNIEFMRQDPFLLYRNPKSIFGIWFYDTTECDRVSYLLDELVSAMKRTPADSVTPSAPIAPDTMSSGDTRPKQVMQSSTTSNAGSAILQMLSRAHSDYDKKGEPPSVISKPVESGTLFRPQAVKPDSRDGRKSIDIDELFRNASQNFKDKTTTSESLMLPTEHAFHRPPAPPPDHVQTVTDLEKEHPSVNQSELITPASLGSAKTTLSASVPTIPLLDSVAPQMKTPSKNPPQETLVTDTLMSPMAFSVSHMASSTRKRLADSPKPVPEVSVVSLPHAAAESKPLSSAADAHQSHASTVALTKDQLLQAFEYLLRTDDDFKCSLHKAYIDSLNASMKR